MVLELSDLQVKSRKLILSNLLLLGFEFGVREHSSSFVWVSVIRGRVLPKYSIWKDKTKHKQRNKPPKQLMLRCG